VWGTTAPARRKATADEIREINEKLEAFDKGLQTPAAPSAPAAPAA